MNKLRILKNHRFIINRMMRFVVVFGALYYLAFKISPEYITIRRSIDVSALSFPLVLTLLLLAVFNWGLEAKKWQVLTDENSLGRAYKSVLLGLLCKQFIPLGLGELSGRMLSFERKNRLAVLPLYLVGAGTQFVVTVFFGLLGVKMLLTSIIIDTNHLTTYGRYALMAFPVTIGLLYFYRKSLNDWFRSVFKRTKELDFHKIVHVFILSVLRYLIFFGQFYLLISYCNWPLSQLHIVGGIAFIFLVKTTLPTINFMGDLGIREFSAVLYFTQFGLEAVPVIFVSVFIWIINIFLPAMVALFFVKSLKLIPVK